MIQAVLLDKKQNTAEAGLCQQNRARYDKGKGGRKHTAMFCQNNTVCIATTYCIVLSEHTSMYLGNILVCFGGRNERE
jgi:hypothetical protein